MKDIHKTSLNVGNNLFLHHIAFKSEATLKYRRHCDSMDKCERIHHNIMPHHAMLNRITIDVTTLIRTLKTEHDVHEMSQSVTIGS